MTLTLEMPDQLAAALEPRMLDPTSWPWTAGPVLGEDDDVPGYLLRARSDADRHSDLAVAWARLAQAAQGARIAEEAVRAAVRAVDLAVDQRSTAALQAASVVLLTHGCSEPLRPLLSDPGAGELPTPLLARIAVELREDERALELLHADDSQDAATQLGWLLLQRNEFDSAIRALRTARKKGATGPVLLANLGYAHAALGNIDKGIRLTREAAALAPGDRIIAFNLAGFLSTAGAYDVALDVLERLGADEETDIELALVMADVLSAAGRNDAARRLLQRVRTSQEWTRAGGVKRAELVANLALLRWSEHRENIDAAAKAVLRALKDCDYRSVSIAYVLANLLRRREQAPVLSRVIAELSKHHPDEDLSGLRLHLAVLDRDPVAALTHARAWSQHDVLNSTAAGLTTHLLCDLAGEFGEAAALGLAALRRSPASTLLLNNTAYALSLAGQSERARTLLARNPVGGHENVALTATRAMTDLFCGDVAAGVAGYRRARELADARGDEGLGLLVELNMALALRRVPDRLLDADLQALRTPPVVPSKLADRSDVWIVLQRVRRELDDLSEAADTA